MPSTVTVVALRDGERDIVDGPERAVALAELVHDDGGSGVRHDDV